MERMIFCTSCGSRESWRMSRLSSSVSILLEKSSSRFCTWLASMTVANTGKPDLAFRFESYVVA